MIKLFADEIFKSGRLVLASADSRNQSLSVITRLQSQHLEMVLERFASTSFDNPRCLDVGCGKSPFRGQVERRGIRYFGLDSDLSESGLGSTGLAAGRVERLPFAKSSFDLIIGTEVMEHVLPTELFLAELYRVAKPGALLFVTVPFAQPLHEQPEDYWRFTKHAIKKILDGSGWKVEMITSRGSLLSLVQHIAVCCFLGVLTKMRLRPSRALKIAHFTVGWTSRSKLLERPSDTFPHGYFVSAYRDG